MTEVTDEEFATRWKTVRPLAEWFVRKVVRVNHDELDDAIQVARIALFLTMQQYQEGRGEFSGLFSSIFKRLLYKMVLRLRPVVSIPVNSVYDTDHPAYQFLQYRPVPLDSIQCWYKPDDPSLDETLSVVDVEEEAMRRITSAELMRMVEELSEPERTAFKLHLGLAGCGAMSLRDVAHCMGCHPTRVHRLVQRAAKRLREMCAAVGYEG